MVDLGSVPAHQPLGAPGLTTLPSRNERQVGDRQSPGGLTPILGMNGAISYDKDISLITKERSSVDIHFMVILERAVVFYMRAGNRSWSKSTAISIVRQLVKHGNN